MQPQRSDDHVFRIRPGQDGELQGNLTTAWRLFLLGKVFSEAIEPKPLRWRELRPRRGVPQADRHERRYAVTDLINLATEVGVDRRLPANSREPFFFEIVKRPTDLPAGNSKAPTEEKADDCHDLYCAHRSVAEVARFFFDPP
jgi:hypothetical protein